MEEREVLIAEEIQRAAQPVVFISQPAGKVALAALSIVAAGIAGAKPALANEIQSAAQPVVFMSQPTPLRIVTGEKLQQYEIRLNQRLGRDGVDMMKNSGGCDSGTSCEPGMSDCDD